MGRDIDLPDFSPYIDRETMNDVFYGRAKDRGGWIDYDQKSEDYVINKQAKCQKYDKNPVYDHQKYIEKNRKFN